jgi:hypothetical protein
MSTIKTLFSIQINNSYYSDPEANNDFDIIPTSATGRLFDRFNLKWFKKNDHDYKLIFTNDGKNFINHLKKNVSSFDFEIFCNRDVFYGYSDVKVGQVYNFNNDDKYPNLHKEQFVSDEDIIELREYRHKLFGLVKISLKMIEKENEFCININSLSSFWTYYISNENFKIKNILKIMSSDNNFVFLKHRGSGDDLIYRSENPITLRDRYNFSILMQYRRLGGESVEEILPSPDTYSNCVSGKEFFSDIEYTVI